MIHRVLLFLLIASGLAWAEPPMAGSTIQIESNGQIFRYVLVPATQPQPEAKVLITGAAPLTYFSSSDKMQSLTANNRTLQGYVVAATFDTEGDHAVTLDGQPGIIRVTPSKRKVVQLSAASKTFPRITDLTELQLPRGAVFEVTEPIKIDGLLCSISAWGDPKLPAPVIRYVGNDKLAVLIEIGPKAANTIVQDITFDSIQTKHQDKNGTPTALRVSGRNTTIRRCTFLNIQIALQTETQPQRLLVQGCQAPLPTGLRAYFAWVQGSDHVYLDNVVANSTREHGIRVNGCDKLTLDGNTISNLDRRNEGDQYDYQKSAINLQVGRYAVVANNRLFGQSSIGPLSGQDGSKDTGSRFSDALITHNTIIGRQEIRHGASNIRFIENTIMGGYNGNAILLDGYSKDYQRALSDVLIENNTATIDAKLGSFIQSYSRVDGCTIRNNTFIAPNLEVGTDQSAVCWLNGPIAGWTFENNHWPLPKLITQWARGGSMYVSSGTDPQANYIDAARWSKLPQVNGDRFEKQLPPPIAPATLESK